MRTSPRGRSGNGPAPAAREVFLLDRRRFLVAVGGAVAYAALRPQLAWARKVRHGEAGLPVLQPWILPDDPPANPLDLARALIGAAVLAPSNWNSQPWRFEVEGTSLRLLADTQRSLPVTDPDQRALMMSLGAALEHLLIAARAYGLRPTVTYAPAGSAHGAVATVSWANGEARRDRALFAAIPLRCTNRRHYDGRGIIMPNRAQLLAQVPDELRVHWLDDHDGIRAVADLAHEATRAEERDSRAAAERFSWMRFGDEDARHHGDGVSLEALEIGAPARWLARRSLDPRSRLARFGVGTLAGQAREAVRSSGALALLTVPHPGETPWLVAGQVYERLALKATQLGIAQQPLSAPIQSAHTRGELARRFGASGEEPLLLVRLGHADRPGHSLRRGVALVASFRMS